MSSGENSGSSPTGEAGDLVRHVSLSIFWVALGTVVSKLIRVAALFVVLGFLQDGELGVAQIALTVFVILQSLTELGLGAALVRTREVSRDDLAALFWVSLAVSLALYVLVFGFSFLIADWYGHPILAPLIQVQGLGVVFFALFVVPKSLLTRDLRMLRVTLAENVAGGLSAVVMIVLAVAGLGIWAIIVGEVSARFIEMVIYQMGRPYFPKFVWAPGRIRGLISFGLYNTGSRFLGRFYTEVDYLVVGKMYTDAQTGLYAFAFRTVHDIVKALVLMVTQVAYPTFAKLQDDKPELERFVFGIARGSSILGGVVLAFIFVFIEPLLLGLGYHQWLPAVHLVRLFCFVGLLRTVLPILNTVINAFGQAHFMFAYAAVLSVVMPVAFIIGALISFEGVVYAWLITFPPITLLLIQRAARLMGISIPRLIRGIGSGLVFPVALALVLSLVRFGLELAGLGPSAVAVVGLVLTLAAGAGFAWRYERAFVDRIFRKKKKAPPATVDSAEPSR